MRSKTTLLLMAMLFLWSGCGDYSNKILEEDLAFLYAVPEKSSLEIRIAENQKRVTNPNQAFFGQRSDSLLGDVATWYLFTVLMSHGVNLHVFGLIDFIDLIIMYPPSAREADVRYWGPWKSSKTPETDWRFIMRRDRQNGMFEFLLQTNLVANQNTSGYPDGWTTCLSGKILPSNEGAGRGLGWMSIDLENCDHGENVGESGTASIGFDTLPDKDNPQGKTYLTIQFYDFITKSMLEKRPDPKPLNALYEYEEKSDFSGKFKFEVWSDLHENQNAALDADEHIELYAQWNTSKAGRADIRVSGGDLDPQAYLIEECWDENRKRVYSSDISGTMEGDAEDCQLEPYVFE